MFFVEVVSILFIFQVRVGLLDMKEDDRLRRYCSADLESTEGWWEFRALVNDDLQIRAMNQWNNGVHLLYKFIVSYINILYASSIQDFKESSVISGDSFCLCLSSRTLAERP